MTAAFVPAVLQDRPTPAVLARLRGRHSGRLVTIGVDDDAATSAEVMGVFSRQRIGASVVYGSITEVAGRPSGSLTYELSGENIDAALANLRGRAEMIDWGSATQEVDR